MGGEQFLGKRLIRGEVTYPKHSPINDRKGTQGNAMARKTFCTFDPNALAMAAAGLFCWAISTEATALGNEVPMAHTVMPLP